MPVPIVHHPVFTAPISPEHRFPMQKFARLIEVILADGLVAPGQVVLPEPASRALLARAHARAYVDAVCDVTVDTAMAKRIGLPMTAGVAARSRAACGGTLLAARLALAEGLGCNTAGGSHHADTKGGAGFCVFNDVAVAARALLDDGTVGRVLVIDLDVHQGDGTAEIFAGDDAVFTFSLHCEANYPAEKKAGDWDVPVAAGLDDHAYLEIVDSLLDGLLAQTRPDIVFYNAGVDPHVDDLLGKLALTDAGLAARDALVLDRCRDRRIPVACVIGGGYDADIDVLARRHATIHRAAADRFDRERLRPRRQTAGWG